MTCGHKMGYPRIIPINHLIISLINPQLVQITAQVVQTKANI